MIINFSLERLEFKILFLIKLTHACACICRIFPLAEQTQMTIIKNQLSRLLLSFCILFMAETSAQQFFQRLITGPKSATFVLGTANSHTFSCNFQHLAGKLYWKKDNILVAQGQERIFRSDANATIHSDPGELSAYFMTCVH